MTPLDTMLIAAILAAAILQYSSAKLQEKWRLYEVFVGNKYGYIVHIALVVLAWFEVVAVSVLLPFSRWDFPSIWFIGVPLFAYALYMLLRSLRSVGMGFVFNLRFFPDKRHKQPKRRDTLRLFASVCLVFVSLALIFGQYGYGLAAIVLLALLFVAPIAYEKINAYYRCTT